MNRYSSSCFALAATILLALGCGGSTDEGGGGSGGTAGSAGSGGTAGSATVPAWQTCEAEGQCVLQADGCCPWCPGPTAPKVEAVGREPGQLAAYFAEQCPTPTECPNCPAVASPTAAAFCVDGSCRVINIRQNPIASCDADSDCVLRYAGCCESCAGPDSAMLVALNKSKVHEYESQLCSPDAPACEPCTPSYPPDYRAICVSDGHCSVRGWPL